MARKKKNHSKKNTARQQEIKQIILPKGKSSKSGISLDGVIYIYLPNFVDINLYGCRMSTKTASPIISFHQPFPDTKLKTKRQGSVIGFGGFFNAGHGNFNTSWRFSAWIHEPWKRWLRQRPTELWWSRGAKGSKPREKCVVYSSKDFSVLLVFFLHFCPCSRYNMQISGLVFKSSVRFGGFSFRMVKKCHCYCGGDRFVGEVKKWPSVSSDSAHWLGIWGWIGPLFTSPSPNPRISTKMDFWKPPFEKIRDLRRFFLVYVTCWFSKKRGKSILKPFTMTWNHPLQSGEMRSGSCYIQFPSSWVHVCILHSRN